MGGLQLNKVMSKLFSPETALLTVSHEYKQVVEDWVPRLSETKSLDFFLIDPESPGKEIFVPAEKFPIKVHSHEQVQQQENSAWSWCNASMITPQVIAIKKSIYSPFWGYFNIKLISSVSNI